MLQIDYHVFAIVAAFIILDVISGFAQACKNKTISSVKMRDGLWHKFSYVLIIILAVVCEYSTGYLDLGFTMPITIPVCAFISLTELVSIIENIGRLNPEIAKTKLLDFFSQNKNRRTDDIDKTK